jgi:hypothetical protein
MRIEPRARAGRSGAARALLLVAGCGEPDPFDRVGVSGSVTLGGAPIQSGDISFVPLQEGPSIRGSIADGAYAIARAEGPGVGPYRVEVYSVRPTGRRIPDGDNPGETIEETRNAVPDRYNLRSKLQVLVRPGEDQEFDFPLENAK